MSKKEKINELLDKKQIEETIDEIDNTMALEGMPLTEEIRENIRKCFMGESNPEKECQRVIERYKRIYG